MDDHDEDDDLAFFRGLLLGLPLAVLLWTAIAMGIAAVFA